jgi:hypothetical protein
MNRLQSQSTIATPPITYTKYSNLIVGWWLPVSLIYKESEAPRIGVGDSLPISTTHVPLITESLFSIRNISVDLELNGTGFNNSIRALCQTDLCKKSKNPSHWNVSLSKKITRQKTLFNTFIFIHVWMAKKEDHFFKITLHRTVVMCFHVNNHSQHCEE